jgi:hypothetical protein
LGITFAEEPVKARAALLACEPNEFLGKYYVTSQGFVGDYCDNLFDRALTLLYEAVKGKIISDIGSVEGLRAFPLVRGPGVPDLTIKELRKAKEAIVNLGRFESAAEHWLTKMKFGTTDKGTAISDAIKNLLNPAGLDDTQKKYLKRVGGLLNALPDPDKPIFCTISCGEQTSLDRVAEQLKIEQGDTSLVLSLTASKYKGKVIDLKEEGDDINLNDQKDMAGVASKFKFQLPGKPLKPEFGYFEKRVD